MPPRLILASTSRYRRELLDRLKLAFTVMAPGVDETPLDDESPPDTAVRLARAKAMAVAQQHTDAVVIGSDQVAVLGDEIIGKPGSHAAAFAQLKRLSGRDATFHTAVAVAVSGQRFLDHDTAVAQVRYRRLDDAEIERYLRIDQPYDCAGSARGESLGIALLDSVACDDPTALIGLPLIRTCRLLRAAGLDPLAAR